MTNIEDAPFKSYKRPAIISYKGGYSNAKLRWLAHYPLMPNSVDVPDKMRSEGQ